jgi:3D (Asp-Asp-Asp) domain-containing protein
VTATGVKTHFGVIAASRDLLEQELPYGSLVRITDLGNFHNGQGEGAFQEVLDEQEVFVVEDTMHRRKQEQVDVWFETREEAENWGVRYVEVEVLRYGRDGPDMAQWQTQPDDAINVAVFGDVGWD